MASDVSDRVREIARYRELEEAEIIQRALENGIDNLWRDVVISKYLKGEIGRSEAVDDLGADVVNRVDQAKDALNEDIEWGLDELKA